MNSEAPIVAEKISNITGLDIFRNTRKREYIEARALLNFILKNTKGMTLYAIKDFYIANGKAYDHATVLHSLSNFDMYRKYNKNIDKWLKIFSELYDDIDAKREVIINNLIWLKNDNINALYDITNDMYQQEIINKIEVEAEVIMP